MSGMASMDSLIERLRKRNPNFNDAKIEMTEKERVESLAKSFNANDGDQHLFDGYECAVCKNKGVINVAKEYKNLDGTSYYAECMVECKCAGIRKSIRRMKRSGMEPLLKKYRFDNFNVETMWQEKIKSAAMKFAKNPGKAFFIGGQSGSGKSHLCTAIIRELLYGGMETRYVIWREKAAELKACINDDVKYQTLINELKQVDLLYLDDFLKMPIGQSSDKPSSADLSLALEIINSRYNSTDLVTIISSEWTTNELIGFDEALGGRIYEMAGPEHSANLKKDSKKNYRIRNIEEL